jgi:hypothetical protein
MLLNMMRWFSFASKNAWLMHAARTAIAAAGSLAIARLCKMPEAYWAPISAIIVTQSTLGASWTTAKQRFIGTALGAVCGGLLTSYFEPQLFTFGAAILCSGSCAPCCTSTKVPIASQALPSRLSCSWGEGKQHGSSDFTASWRSRWALRLASPSARSGPGIHRHRAAFDLSG